MIESTEVFFISIISIAQVIYSFVAGFPVWFTFNLVTVTFAVLGVGLGMRYTENRVAELQQNTGAEGDMK